MSLRYVPLHRPEPSADINNVVTLDQSARSDQRVFRQAVEPPVIRPELLSFMAHPRVPSSFRSWILLVPANALKPSTSRPSPCYQRGRVLRERSSTLPKAARSNAGHRQAESHTKLFSCIPSPARCEPLPKPTCHCQATATNIERGGCDRCGRTRPGQRL